MATQLNDDRLLTRKEVHEHFGLTQRYLEYAVQRGGGPPLIRFGRSVRYRVGDLREWIDAKTVHRADN